MSNQGIADKIISRINNLISNELPLPDCPVKREKVKWDREEVNRLVMEKLSGYAKTYGPTEIK